MAEYFYIVTGYSIPLGMVETQGQEYRYNYTTYSEYIVEDHRQVCLKYLVQFTKASAR
jgi:penicillin V acylase-like amidase (Ntn superfamily)